MKKRIIEIMRETRTHCFLALSKSGQPSIRVMTPLIENDMRMWMMTFSTSDKVRILKGNDRAALLFCSHPGWEREVHVSGKIRIEDSVEEKKRLFNLAEQGISQYFPDGPETEPFCLLEMIPEVIRWRDGYSSQPQEYRP